MWDLPGPGLESVSPALAGGFLTTAPPGKSLPKTFNLFEQRTVPGAFYSLPGKVFPLREFCKGRNKWKSEGSLSGEYGG